MYTNKCKAIEKAKKILMEENSISEGDAFILLRTEAMNKRMEVKEMAELLIYSRGCEDGR